MSGSLKIGGGTITWDSATGAFHFSHGLYSDSFISGKGLNSDAGSTAGGGSGEVSLADITDMGDVWKLLLGTDTIPDTMGRWPSWSEVTGKPSWIPTTDGAGSGIDADLLDGTHKSGLFTAMTYSGNRLTVTIGGTSRSVTINAGSSGSYLPLSGGTITGDLTVRGSVTTSAINGRSSDHLYLDSASGYDVGIRRGGSTSNGVSLGDGALRPFYASAGVLTLGTSDQRFRTIYSVNSLNTSSDLSLKSILRNIALTVEDVAAAPSFLYRWKNGKDERTYAGSSAQYWQRALPEAVLRGEDGYLSMEYDRLALASVITVAKTVIDHEERIKRLEKMIENH